MQEKKKRNAQRITVVIHNAFGCGETMISPHPLEMYKFIQKNYVGKHRRNSQ